MNQTNKQNLKNQLYPFKKIFKNFIVYFEREFVKNGGTPYLLITKACSFDDLLCIFYEVFFPEV